MLVMLGAHYDERLTDVEKQRVEAEIARMLTGLGSDFRGPIATNWAVDAAFRAAAMATVGIKLMGDLAWSKLMEPWPEDDIPESSLWTNGQSAVDIRFLSGFRPMDPATEEAKRYLRSLGLEIPEIGPWSLPRTDGLGTIGPGEAPKARSKPNS
ncbi:hypothetical protein [Usitatibacter rugosus]|uniref:hypothetical protein n=1 Tax=Usitatibacter rugosus TaxID=2732067 RepID=UPI0014891C9F|nr:hypothetical protein [Usitatibacter rugosus]